MKKTALIFLLFFVSSVNSISVDLDLNQNSGNSPLDVNLTAVVSDGIPQFVFEWDFEGDGTIDATTNSPNNSIIHTYSTGYYTATVKATDLINNSAEDTKELSVANQWGNFLPEAFINNSPYTVSPGQRFMLDPRGSKDKAGNIRQYRWTITTLTGNPQCPERTITVNYGGGADASTKEKNESTIFFDDDPEDEELPRGAAMISCNGIGTARLVLEVIDNGSPSENAFYSTIITVRELYNEDLINIVKIMLNPEMIKGEEDLTATITIRNVTNRDLRFNLFFEVKENKTDTNISALPNLIPGLQITNQQIEKYSQKDFTLTITKEQLQSLASQQNYWVYAKAEAINTEENITFNSRRAIFSYNKIKSIQLPETNLTGIIIVLLLSLIILKR